jgi:hypothetical protein
LSFGGAFKLWMYATMFRAVVESTCFTARRMIVVSVNPNVLMSNPSREA